MVAMVSRYIFSFILIVIQASSFAQKPEFTKYLDDPWVKQQMQQMTLRQKIGQLIMIEVYPDQSELHRGNIIQHIKQYQPGGILIMKGNPTKTIRWINDFKLATSVPLLMAIDGETGPAFRIDSLLTFPNAQALGAIQGTDAVYQIGKSIGKQMRNMGLNMNFAPVADINTNPANPIINFRAFGDNRTNVAHKAEAFAKGLQDAGVVPVVKHFPGHGDSKTDSHHSLPVLQHSASRLDSVELYPFRYLARNGIAGIMSGHLSIPALDPSQRPSSLSEPIITGILRNQMGYEGLVITDAMNMKGVTMPSGQAEVQALKAGNDMVEFVTNLPGAVSAIEKAVSDGVLSIETIDHKVRKILAIKRWIQSFNSDTAVQSSLAQLNHASLELSVRNATEQSLTVLANKNLIPLERIDTLQIATVNIGDNGTQFFQQMTDRYTSADHFHLPADATQQQIDDLSRKLKPYNLVIAGIGGLRTYPGRNYGVTSSQVNALKTIRNNTRLITLVFGNAYAMRYLTGVENSDALVLGYQDNRFSQELAVQLIFGALDANGRLPVTVDNRFKTGMGLEVKKNGRLKYTIPEEVGISTDTLSKWIDQIVNEGLKEKAYPGGQVLIARKGKVIYHKCYGYLTYDNDEPVVPENVYDWASVTKVTGPLPALMRLHDEGKFDLNKKLGDYRTDFKGSDKENIPIRDVLTHQARLRPIIPLWQSQFARNAKLREEVFTNRPVADNDLRVSTDLYISHHYRDQFFKEIRESTLLPRKSYTYTCIGFHLWPDVISKLTGKPYEEYIKDTFYRRLGANSITYNAYLHFPQSQIVPTESDDYFRMETLRGFVHDEGAAILGGVSGNAGLFGSVNDIAKLFQMYLAGGYYGGEQFIKKTTLEEFTRVQFAPSNRRGLGFDKPEINNHLKPQDDPYPSSKVSPRSFGHSGYTGTFVWADPETEILYIFFTNRVYPTRNNNLISQMRIRGAMLDAIYDSIGSFSFEN